MLMQNFRLAIRQFASRPAFFGVVVLVMAIGVGANAAIFTIVDAVLLPAAAVQRSRSPGEPDGDLPHRRAVERVDPQSSGRRIAKPLVGERGAVRPGAGHRV